MDKAYNKTAAVWLIPPKGGEPMPMTFTFTCHFRGYTVTFQVKVSGNRHSGK